MRKKVMAVVVTVALVACGEGQPAEDDDWTRISGGAASLSVIYYGEFELPDGRVIPCIAWNGYQKGGMSCDWNAR